MRYRIKKGIYFLLTIFTAIAVGSCRDDLFIDDADSEYMNIKFTLAPEAASMNPRTRAGASQALIGDGGKADVLIYAVYEVKSDGSTTLCREYGHNVSEVKGFTPGIGQTVKDVGSFPATLQLQLKRGKKYQIAFWAQSSKVPNAYDTDDLKKVEMVYSNMQTVESDGEDGEDQNGEGGAASQHAYTPNNDDYRDAFCRTVEVEAGKSGSLEQNVYLYRPLAQINIGTNGYDYEMVTRDAVKKYRYSKIRINRVARYLNVVEDRVYYNTSGDDNFEGVKDRDAFSVVDYDYAPIPGYANYQNYGDKEGNFPEYPSYTVYDWEYGGTDFVAPNSGVLKSDYEDEQFLKVHHEKTSGKGFVPKRTINGVKEEFSPYANLLNYEGYDSETFKYLSMCYVLTSSSKDEGVVINNIKAWIATSPDGADAVEIVNIDQVPAQRNWRTNIVGNILTEENNFTISLDQDFAGEYDAWKNDGWEWSGPLARGVYYDAEADEILISSAEGLVWLQRMVNGDLKKRETASRYWNDRKYGVGQYYWYNDGSGVRQLSIDGIKKPDDPQLVKRIMRATHQDLNTNQTTANYDEIDPDGWPVGNRFHFIGYNPVDKSESRAKVKLVADIDLSGIEWIPIGFESKTIDQMSMHGYGASDGLGEAGMSQSFGRDKEIKTFSAKNSNPHIRGFWGEFDGNGHTISNLKTKRFGVSVMDWEPERGAKFTAPAPDRRMFSELFHFTDALPWFGRGLFGQIFASAKIRNVRLTNVDIKGCNGVGGIVGIAYGDSIEITNCIVDGGQLVNTPMLRGDMVSNNAEYDNNNRTFARGVYTGGIVGCFNTRFGRVDNCMVNNVTIQGYRRVGGLIGTVDLADNEDASVNTDKSRSNPISISNNTVSNTTIIGTAYAPFTRVLAEYDNTAKVEKTGMGYTDSKYNLNMQRFVGGDSRDYISKFPGKCTGNNPSNITFAEMEIKYDQNPEKPGVRISYIDKAPLSVMPLLSSWYVDEVTLRENYSGNGVAKKIQQLHRNFYHNTFTKDALYSYPFDFPNNVEVTWMPSQTPNIGLYVESVNLTGAGIGNRSVITPDNVTDEGSAVMFVTSRDHKAYFDNLKVNTGANWYKKDTKINNFVLRGQPYAYTGLLISPNENMKSVQLNNVAIYDVFQTIALDNAYQPGDYWPNRQPNASGVELVVKNSNLRGYTVPGAGWTKISYNTTTFEAGAATGHDVTLERTCKVQAPTEFSSCFFKAPYVIDLSSAPSYSFTKCYATATSNNNREIIVPQGCKRIVISRSAQGDPIVTYYGEGNSRL